MPDYSKTVIYVIRCLILGVTETYVGSTVNPTSRKSGHHNACINEKNRAYHFKIYKFIRDNGGWENWEFVILEEYPECVNKIQKLIRERQVADRLNSTLNSIRAYTSDLEKVEQMRDLHSRSNPISNAIHNPKTIVCELCNHTYRSCNIVAHSTSRRHLACM